MTWTLHDKRWYLIGAPEFVVAWEDADGQFHWSVGTPRCGVTQSGTHTGRDIRMGSLYRSLADAQARAIEVMTERHEEAKAALRKITDPEI